jgi:hypothetical protein
MQGSSQSCLDASSDDHATLHQDIDQHLQRAIHQGMSKNVETLHWKEELLLGR